jgi:hypothetical protein
MKPLECTAHCAALHLRRAPAPQRNSERSKYRGSFTPFARPTQFPKPTAKSEEVWFDFECLKAVRAQCASGRRRTRSLSLFWHQTQSRQSRASTHGTDTVSLLRSLLYTLWLSGYRRTASEEVILKIPPELTPPGFGIASGMQTRQTQPLYRSRLDATFGVKATIRAHIIGHDPQ